MTGTAVAATREEEFERLRPLLFSVAYRMLGSAHEAEDVVQDAYLRYSRAERGEIRNLKSFLITVTARLAMDQLRSARVRRERYIGPWLPEPLADAPDPVQDSERLESVSLAFLRVLEKLTPLERATFLLHDVFDYGYDEVAAVVERSEAACRQSVSRARKHLREERPRFRPSLAKRRRMTAAFLKATQEGQLENFLHMLRDDAVLYSDGGGIAAAALNPIYGKDRIARLMRAANFGAWPAEVNGEPGIALYRGGEFAGVMSFEWDGDQVSEILVVLNPEKLARVRP